MLCTNKDVVFERLFKIYEARSPVPPVASGSSPGFSGSNMDPLADWHTGDSTML